MRFEKPLVYISMLLLGSAAYAQDQTPPEAAANPPPAVTSGVGAASGPGAYSGPEINRPLSLPQGGMEGDLAPVMIQRFSISTMGVSASTTGESLAMGFRYGLVPNMTAGALLAFRLNPDANFTDFLVNGLYEFMPGSAMMAAGRVDLGVTHGTDTNLFDVGLGVPLKYALTPMFALISGSQYEITTFGATGSQDILFLQLGDTNIIGLNIPVGVLAQLSPMVAAQVRTGFGLVHTDAADAKFVPLNFDLIGNLNLGGVGLDPYFTFNLAGSTDDYTALMNILVGVRAHL